MGRRPMADEAFDFTEKAARAAFFVGVQAAVGKLFIAGWCQGGKSAPHQPTGLVMTTQLFFFPTFEDRIMSKKTTTWICNVDGTNYVSIKADSAEEALQTFVRDGMELWTQEYNPDDIEPDHSWEPGETVYYRAFVHQGEQGGKNYREAAVSVAVDPEAPECSGAAHTWTVRESGQHTMTRVCTTCGCEWFTDSRHPDPYEYPDGVVPFVSYMMPGGEV